MLWISSACFQSRTSGLKLQFKSLYDLFNEARRTDFSVHTCLVSVPQCNSQWKVQGSKRFLGLLRYIEMRTG